MKYFVGINEDLLKSKFILVENKCNKYDEENDIRNRLENYFGEKSTRNDLGNYNIQLKLNFFKQEQTILISMNGSIETLRTIWNYLKNKQDIILISVNKIKS